MQWHYDITSSKNTSKSFATKTGWGNRIPLTTRVIPKGDKKQNNTTKSLMDIDVENLLLVNAKPALTTNGIVLHIRETEGDHAIVDINRLKEQTGATEIFEVNVLENPLKKLIKPLLVEHFETKFILLKLE